MVMMHMPISQTEELIVKNMVKIKKLYVLFHNLLYKNIRNSKLFIIFKLKLDYKD